MTKVQQLADSQPAISFVIPVRNDARRLAGCLESIAANDYPRDRVEVIVVNNGSTDGSDVVARQARATVLTITGVHVGELRNRGAAAASGEILAFVDADHEIDAGWVRHGVDGFGDAGIGAVGALCEAPPNGTWVQKIYDTLRARTPGRYEVSWLGSGNLAVRAEAFRQVGGFDATLQTCEDVDLCRRLIGAGYRIINDDRLRNVHLGDPATLGALFASELWRGRDNLRTSLRGPISWRGLPSVAIPIIDVAGLAFAIAGVLTAPLGGLLLTAAALIGIGACASLRAARMLAARRALGAGSAVQSLAVALVYDVARAVALVMPASHRTRQAASAQ